jgi:hypothetical protein
MIKYYVLDKNNNPKPVSVQRWSFTFEHNRRTVAQEVVGGIYISTIFLGIDYSFGMGGPPLVFETMAFDADEELMCRRYSTWDEAVAGHQEIVEACKTLSGLTIDLLMKTIK